MKETISRRLLVSTVCHCNDFSDSYSYFAFWAYGGLLNDDRTLPVFARSFQRRKTILNNMLAIKITFRLTKLLEQQWSVGRIFPSRFWTRHSQAEQVVDKRGDSEANHPSSLIDVYCTGRHPRRVICADQPRDPDHRSRQPCEQSLEIPAFGAIVQAACSRVEKGERVYVALLDEEIVDDDDLKDTSLDSREGPNVWAYSQHI